LNSQRDQHGIIGHGTYHSAVSEAGCIVLAADEKAAGRGRVTMTCIPHVEAHP
jgi:hypothetical protein